MEEPDDLPDLVEAGRHQVSDCVDSGGVDHWWSDHWDSPESEEVLWPGGIITM